MDQCSAGVKIKQKQSQPLETTSRANAALFCPRDFYSLHSNHDLKTTQLCYKSVCAYFVYVCVCVCALNIDSASDFSVHHGAVPHLIPIISHTSPPLISANTAKDFCVSVSVSRVLPCELCSQTTGVKVCLKTCFKKKLIQTSLPRACQVK
ncbi:hypothetical protein E3U43_020406 [Larimichthys crocea]|uniref:Uncharacterized protein n=1 Tax=Larimichthys crocea TaxID=215358 RepID=A0ACD3QW95_LARCR|nr:hypothetical protein E3U43_020406 [Larimichthys crocea]